MAGIPISKLEENTTLSDSSMFAEAESSPASTKKVTFATLFSAIWNKIKGKRVKTYDEIMATTDDEFWASATGIKDGFTQLNTKKANKISLKTFSFEKTLRAKTVESGSVSRKQFGIADNEEILFMTLEPQYISGSFYQGIDLSFLLVSTSGNSDNDALIYNAYNDTTSSFENVPFIARAIVQQL